MLRNNYPRAKQAQTVYVLAMLVSGALCLVDSAALTMSDWKLVAQGLAAHTTLAVFFARLLLLLAKLALIICGYVFLIRWLRRAYYNLHQLPGIHPDYSEGWAAGAWFVPFINLARPFTIMREVWNDTQLAAFGEIKTPATLLGWWWAAYLINSILSWITSQAGRGSSASATSELTAEIISQAFSLVTALLTWLVVRKASGFEEALTYRLKVADLGQPATAPALATDQSDYALEEGY